MYGLFNIESTEPWQAPLTLATMVVVLIDLIISQTPPDIEN
jgi:hypothetical protein